jgi:hypothetical protein
MRENSGFSGNLRQPVGGMARKYLTIGGFFAIFDLGI